MGTDAAALLESAPFFDLELGTVCHSSTGAGAGAACGVGGCDPASLRASWLFGVLAGVLLPEPGAPPLGVLVSSPRISLNFFAVSTCASQPRVKPLIDSE